MPFRDQFPDYPPGDMPPIPEGFDDVSWENDSCPSFLNEAAGLIIFCDFADPALREWPECPRFSLGAWDVGATGETLAQSDDFADILSAIEGETRTGGRHQ